MTSHTRRKISASRSEAETRPLAATEPIRTERSAGEKEPATALSGAGFASFWLEGKLGTSLCSAPCTSLKCPYFRMA
jgi:hypothetical protein